MSGDVVVGIDLGTTNSEVAALKDGRVRVLGPGEAPMLPSCVGLSPTGELLVGRAARNQLLIFPERTVKSIKRKMGTGERVKLGDREFSPEELSALVLRELATWAERSLGVPVRKAVLTVPAYFSDAQRNATRAAGALAGLEVVRILNEPTAASLAFGQGDGQRRTLLIYDLGGGTLDVSVVVAEGDVTEVLASHGDTQLGGDDFDALLLEQLLGSFRATHGVDLREDRIAVSRLLVAAEAAKRALSERPDVAVREESLAIRDGVPLHLTKELQREEYEALIRPLVERSLASVSRALQDAGKRPADLDGILLVGGSTRTPLVSRLLEERTGIVPRQEVHPDLCVALGAGVLASRLSGHDVDRVLVDVSPYSFGPSHLDERDGELYPYCYRPLLRRNTPLPLTRSERYFTASNFQPRVELDIFQGEDADALKNLPIGHFAVEGLTKIEGPNEVIVEMSLDLDGILHVCATEKRTGLSKRIRIEGATRTPDEAALAEGQARLAELWASRRDAQEGDETDDEQAEAFEAALPIAAAAVGPSVDPAERVATDAGRALIERAREALGRMHDEDREEAIALIERLQEALEGAAPAALAAPSHELRELLFFVDGKR